MKQSQSIFGTVMILEITRKSILTVLVLVISFFFGQPAAIFAEQEPQNTQESVLVYDFPEYTANIESKPTGGRWDHPSTWIQDRVPVAGDLVKINGLVYMNYVHTADLAGVYITEQGELKRTSGTASLNTDMVILEHNALLDSIHTTTQELYNYGEITTQVNFNGTEINNHGEIHTLRIQNPGSYTFQNLENTIVSFDVNATLVGNQSFKKIQLAENVEISFTQENAYITTEAISGVNNTIHGGIRGVAGSGLDFGNMRSITANTIVVADDLRFKNNMNIYADMVFLPGSNLYNTQHYSVRDFIIHGDLDVREGVSFNRPSIRVDIVVHGNFTSAGEYMYQLVSHNGSPKSYTVEVYGDVALTGGLVPHMILHDNGQVKNISGSEFIQRVSLGSDVNLGQDLSISEFASAGYHLDFEKEGLGTLEVKGTYRRPLYSKNFHRWPCHHERWNLY